MKRYPHSGEMLGRSQAMREVFRLTGQVAGTDVDVLIIGETGTGKELVARSIHQLSARNDGPFVPVDCGAIPGELMESEFFGYEKGAFTGAQRQNTGLIEHAHRGTFFLDEIGQLSLSLQAKLLRALQERTIHRLGSNRQIDVDVRIIAATSLDLEAEVKAGRFRLDLFYRIHVARIDLPPLRERVGDLPILIEHFLYRFARDMNREGVSLSPDAIEVLSSYSWPGNVRELQNVLKRILVTAPRRMLEVNDLPEDLVAAIRRVPGIGEEGFFAQRARRVAMFEREYFIRLLEDTKGDVSQAARQAKLPRGTLYRLLKNHELIPEDFRQGDTYDPGI